MDHLGKPRGLVRYASENSIANGEPLRYTTRMKLYTGLCLFVLSLLSIILITRKDIDATVMRTPGILYQERGTDSISNLYNIKVVNKTTRDIPLYIKMEDNNGTIQTIGKPYVEVVKEGQGSGSFFVIIPKKIIKERNTKLRLGIYEGNKKISVIQTSFLGPISE